MSSNRQDDNEFEQAKELIALDLEKVLPSASIRISPHQSYLPFEAQKSGAQKV